MLDKRNVMAMNRTIPITKPKFLHDFFNKNGNPILW
jgi:hypothetical protein